MIIITKHNLSVNSYSFRFSDIRADLWQVKDPSYNNTLADTVHSIVVI